MERLIQGFDLSIWRSSGDMKEKQGRTGGDCGDKVIRSQKMGGSFFSHPLNWGGILKRRRDVHKIIS